MKAFSGAPVLASLDVSQIPAVSSLSALAGLAAGFLAALAYAGRHDAGGKILFNRAVVAARVHPDYDYSHGFLRGVVMATPELEALAVQIGATS